MAKVTLPEQEYRVLRRKAELYEKLFQEKPEKVLSVENKELLDWTKKFIEKYRPALETLAKK
jgi:hypothetical protein